MCSKCGNRPPILGHVNCKQCSKLCSVHGLNRRKHLKINDVCQSCGKMISNGRARCGVCSKKSNDRRKIKRRKNVSNGLCANCGKCSPAPDIKLCKVCRDIFNKRGRRHRSSLRLETFSYYCGGKPRCQCCGENMLDFLTLDHINNDGAEHRRSMGLINGTRGNCTTETFRWLKKHNFPDGFQVLCANCNLGKLKNGGTCPHVSKSRG